MTITRPPSIPPIRVLDVRLGMVEISRETPGILLLDIDGTIADNGHRIHHLETVPKDWDAYESKLPHDPPITPIIAVVQEMKLSGWTIVGCTGRSEAQRLRTVDWLKRHAVPVDVLYMRREGDRRLDTTVKAELLDAIRREVGEPTLAFEDRDRVVAMWAEKGVKCVQTKEGSY